MSEVAIRHLLLCEARLLAALDGSDAAAIEAAAHHVGEALEQVRTIPPERRATQTAMLRQALDLAEAGRRQTNMLADRARTRLDRLAAIGGIEKAPARYGRAGRLV